MRQTYRNLQGKVSPFFRHTVTRWQTEDSAVNVRNVVENGHRRLDMQRENLYPVTNS